MSIETWGLLPKSQIDAQTINQAIAQAISDHNDDANAHTGVGQSLYNHVQNPILDHRAGSIPADKFSLDNFVLQSNFENLAPFTTNGTVFQQYPFLRLNTSGALNAVSWLSCESTNNMYELKFDQFPIFQINFRASSVSNYKGYFIYGLEVNASDGKCIGFEFTNNAINGYVRLGTTKYTTSTWTLDTNNHIYRAYVDPITHDAVFTVDGVQKGTIPASSYYSAGVSWPAMDNLFEIWTQATTAAVRGFYISSLLIGSTPV